MSTMFKFISRNFPHLRTCFGFCRTENLYFLHVNPLSTSSGETRKSIGNREDKQRFTVNYLVNTFGFTQVEALSVAKYATFTTPKKPDSVYSVFKNHGFTKSQITRMFKVFPAVILCNPQKTLLPKIKFFQSFGVSSNDLAAILSVRPQIFKRSLEKKVIPALELIRDLCQSHQKKFSFTKSFCAILCYGILGYAMPNIQTLRECGFPDSNIAILVKYQSRALNLEPTKFRKAVEEVKGMGFNPSIQKFFVALHVLRSMNKSTWQMKVETYKKWGLSEDEIFEAFKRNPWFMTTSEEKITRIMDFLVNKAGFQSSVVLKRPNLTGLSVHKTIVPRCTVYQALSSKGLIPRRFSLAQMLEMPEKKFLKKYVDCFEAEASELLRLYMMNMPVSKQMVGNQNEGAFTKIC